MKKIIYICFFVFCIISFSNENYSELYYENKKIEYELASFFNAIKIFNNRYAMSFIDKNPKKLKNQEKNYNIEIIEENKEDNHIDINRADKNGYTAIIIAIEYNNIEIVEELLKNNVNLDVVHPIFGKTVLNTAVFNERLDIVKLLLNYNGELINKSDKDGWTPIMDAVLKNNVDILKYLLSKGADPLKRDKTGYNSLDLALKFSKGEAIKIIKDYIDKKE